MSYLTRQTLHMALERAITAQSWPFKDQAAPLVFWVRPAPVGRGEYATNVAMTLASMTGLAPHAIIDILSAHLTLEILHWGGGIAFEEAKGFLNFRLDDTMLNEMAARAVRAGARYGAGASLAGRRVNVEFVSADPTGPLSLTYARSAAGGEALCRVLEFQGADVTREFFVNDAEASSKMRLLGESVAAFYLAAFGRTTEWPEGAVQDSFIRNVAETIAQREGNKYLLVPDSERATAFAREVSRTAVAQQKRVLQEFGVRFDVWTSENALSREGRIESVVQKLKTFGHTYERDGAVWLRTTRFGDDHDRPLVRANGQPTYLTADIAYHVFKMERGFDLVLNIWTAQHRPYVQRTRAALQAATCDAGQLEVLLCESARLLRDGAVATGRDGETLTLEETLREIDAATLRFLLLEADWENVVEIETETAQRDDENNPAYAARLVPSRLDTMLRELQAKSATGAAPTSDELSGGERDLLRLVTLWPDEAEAAAQLREPQRIARFMSQLATATRNLLATSRPDTPTSATRLQLLRAAHVTATNALGLLGIEASGNF